jgi:hypothetical protein
MGRTYRRERLDDQVDTGIKRTAVNDRIGRTIDAIVAADANDMQYADRDRRIEEWRRVRLTGGSSDRLTK